MMCGYKLLIFCFRLFVMLVKKKDLYVVKLLKVFNDLVVLLVKMIINLKMYVLFSDYFLFYVVLF